jgi:hypothetical protein
MAKNGIFAGLVFIIAVAAAAVSEGDALYLKERVINSAQPGASQVPFPLDKISAYSTPIGFPFDCSVALTYDGSDPAYWTIPNIQSLCAQGTPTFSPPTMQRVKYPITTEPGQARPGMLFARRQHWCIHGEAGCTDAAPGEALYWNLLYSSNQPGFVFVDRDSGRNRFLQFALMAPHLADDAAVGAYVSYDYKLYYRVSTNGGASFPDGGKFKPVVAAGQTVLHPFPAMYVGQNGGTVPATAFINKTSTGDVLATMTITEGPPSQHVTTVTSGYVLRGRWNAGGTDVTWSISEPASLPATYSTRGVDEPTVMELSVVNSGAVNCILVVRASNEFYSAWTPGNYDPAIAGHQWLFRSKDGCATWDGAPIRFGYSDGTQFYAPAANSTLFRSPQNGRVYWVGPTSASNSQGNWSRTRLIAAEMDLQSSTPGIIKDSVLVLDQMYDLDTDQLQLNNGQTAIQPDGSAFVYLPRQDFGCAACTAPLSWYSLSVAQQNGITLSVTTSGNTAHLLSWQANGASVSKYHVHRRYLSGAPLTDVWILVGSLPGTATSITLSGYERWQEAEYEIVAELTSGAALKSNRVVTRFPSWTAPRLSFSFPTESAPGVAVPTGLVVLNWSYGQPVAPAAFRLYRRYFFDNGTAGPWSVVGDAEPTRRGITIGNYAPTDRFELRMNAVLTSGFEVPGNIVYIRFPTKGDPQRRPY